MTVFELSVARRGCKAGAYLRSAQREDDVYDPHAFNTSHVGETRKASAAYTMQGLVIQVLQDQERNPDWDGLVSRFTHYVKPEDADVHTAMVTTPDHDVWKTLLDCVDVRDGAPLRATAAAMDDPLDRVELFLACMEHLCNEAMRQGMKALAEAWTKAVRTVRDPAIKPWDVLAKKHGLEIERRHPCFIKGEFRVVDPGDEEGNAYYQQFQLMQQYRRGLTYEVANRIINESTGDSKRTYFLMSNSMIVLGADDADDLRKVKSVNADTLYGSKAGALIVGHRTPDGHLSASAYPMREAPRAVEAHGLQRVYTHPGFGGNVVFALSKELDTDPPIPRADKAPAIGILMSILQKGTRARASLPAMFAVHKALHTKASLVTRARESRGETACDRILRRMAIVAIEEIGPVQSMGCIMAMCVAAQSGVWTPGRLVTACLMEEVRAWCAPSAPTFHHSTAVFIKAQEAKLQDMLQLVDRDADAASMPTKEANRLATAISAVCIASSGGMAGDKAMLRRAATVVSTHDAYTPIIQYQKVPSGGDMSHWLDSGLPTDVDPSRLLSDITARTVLMRAVDFHSSTVMSDMVFSSPKLFRALSGFIELAAPAKKAMLSGMHESVARGFITAKTPQDLLRDVVWHSHSNRGATDPGAESAAAHPFTKTLFGLARRGVADFCVMFLRDKVMAHAPECAGGSAFGTGDSYKQYTRNIRKALKSASAAEAPKEEGAMDEETPDASAHTAVLPDDDAEGEEDGDDALKERMVHIGVANVLQPTIDILNLILTRETTVEIGKGTGRAKFLMYTDTNRWLHILRKGSDPPAAYQFPVTWLPHVYTVSPQEVYAFFVGAEEDPWASYKAEHGGELPHRNSEDLVEYTGFSEPDWMSGMRNVVGGTSPDDVQGLFRVLFKAYVSLIRTQKPRFFCPSWWCGEVAAGCPTYEFTATMLFDDASRVLSTRWNIRMREVRCMGAKAVRQVGEEDSSEVDVRTPIPLFVGAKVPAESGPHISPYYTRAGIMLDSVLRGGVLPSLACLLKYTREGKVPVRATSRALITEICDRLAAMVVSTPEAPAARKRKRDPRKQQSSTEEEAAEGEEKDSGACIAARVQEDVDALCAQGNGAYWTQEEVEGGFARARQLLRHAMSSSSGCITIPTVGRGNARVSGSSPVELPSRYDPVAFVLLLATCVHGTTLRVHPTVLGSIKLFHSVPLSELATNMALLTELHTRMCGTVGVPTAVDHGTMRSVSTERALARLAAVNVRRRRTLYPYQTDALMWMADQVAHKRTGCVTLPMGWGKTLVFTTYLLGKEQCTVFVMCPAAACSVWVDEALGSHMPRRAFRVTVLHGQTATKPKLAELQAASDARYGTGRCFHHNAVRGDYNTGLLDARSTHIIVASYNTMTAVMKRRPLSVDVAIADEGDLLSYQSTQRHTLSDAMWAHEKWICTATPIRNNPKDYLPLIQWTSHPLAARGFVDLYLRENPDYMHVVLGSTSRRGDSRFVGDVDRMPDVRTEFSPEEGAAYKAALVDAVRALRARGDVGTVVGSLLSKCEARDRLVKLSQLITALHVSRKAYLSATASEAASSTTIRILRAVCSGNLDSLLHSDKETAKEAARQGLAEPLPVQVSTWQRLREVANESDFMDQTQVIMAMIDEGHTGGKLTWRPTRKAGELIGERTGQTTGWATTYLKGHVFPQDGNVLVFTRSADEMHAVVAHLRSAFSADGSTEWSVIEMDDDASVSVFQRAKNCVGVARIKKMSRAVTLTAAKLAILFGPVYNHNEEDQAYARADRLGQVDRLMVCRMVVKNSVEEHVLHASDVKRSIASMMISANAVESMEGRIYDMFVKGFEEDLSRIGGDEQNGSEDT